jgi:hypothetical protein
MEQAVIDEEKFIACGSLWHSTTSRILDHFKAAELTTTDNIMGKQIRYSH